jgi:zinc protease
MERKIVAWLGLGRVLGLSRLRRMVWLSPLVVAWALSLPVRPAAAQPAAIQPAAPNGSAEARFGLKIDPVDFTPPPVQHATLGNGLTLDYYAETGIPLVTVLVRIGAGSVLDPAGKTGLAAMTGEVLRNGGTTAMNGDELDRALEARGAQLSVETTREETWLRLSVLKEDAEWGMGLLKNVLTQPAFPAAKLDEERERQIVELRQRLDVPRDIGQAMFPQTVFGRGNPWGWTKTEQTLKNLSTADLKAFYERYYRPENGKLGVTGDIPWDQAQALAEKFFGTLPRTDFTPPALPAAEPVKAAKVYIVPRATTQNVIYIGHEGIQRFDPDKFPVKIFNNVLSGGFTSRLFKQIRSERGLAYAVYGVLTEGTKQGLFYNVALTKVTSTGETIKLMLDIDRDLTRRPPEPEEMALAKQSEINSFVFFFDSAEKVVRQKMILDAFGYPADYLQTYVGKMKAVSPEQVQAAAQRHVHPDQSIVLVVGQVDESLRRQLEAIGPVEVINDADLRRDWL